MKRGAGRDSHFFAAGRADGKKVRRLGKGDVLVPMVAAENCFGQRGKAGGRCCWPAGEKKQEETTQKKKKIP